MAAIDTRLTCPWCTTRLNAEASVCHGCGAIRARAPLSTVHLFFLHPLGAFALMLGGLALLQLPFVAAVALFAVTWGLFSILYVATRLRRRWMQVEPLLLEDEKDGPKFAHQAPATWAPWWAGAATVAAGLALIWMASPRGAVEQANAAVIVALAPSGSEVASSKRTAAPITVAAVAPPREALPPRSAPNPWPKAETAKVETPKAATAPVETAKIEAAMIETPKVEAAKIETAKTQTAPIDPAKTELPKTELAADAQIMTAQRLLADLGYFSGTPDGKMGPKMRAAVKEFRADMSLGGEAVDGRFISTLESVAAARQQAEARRSQQAEAKRAETRQVEPRRVETRTAVTTLADARPVEARPVQQAEVIQAQASSPPLPQTIVLSPPPLSVLNGLSAARTASQAQAPVRLAPLRQH